MTFKERIARAFRSNKSGNKLVKVDAEERRLSARRQSVKSIGTSRSGYSDDVAYMDNIDEQTGERRDDTALLHGLADNASTSTISSAVVSEEDDRPPGDSAVASLPHELWAYIASYLSRLDAAYLALSSKTLLARLGRSPWDALKGSEALEDRLKLLFRMDEALPAHLLCFWCGVYHLRTRPGAEKLKPTQVLNPVVSCPRANKFAHNLVRTRIAIGHTLPFRFTQLVMRAQRYSPNHGIPLVSLFQRWQDPDSEWKFESSFYIYRGHLLMRVVSRSFTAADLPASSVRNLLYSSREDYTPFFSACAHWRDGDLMKICKCALSHIPKTRQSIVQQLHDKPGFTMPKRPNPIVTLCNFCRPMRRCPECPTEYLVEIKFAEDRNDPADRFKQVIAVTRWSDLGDGIDPRVGEWAAVNGEVGYDSFGAITKRTISSIFESQSGVTIPSHRVMSLNPKNKKMEEDDDDWY